MNQKSSCIHFLKFKLAGLVLVTNAQLAFANSPAIPEDIICRTGNIFIAKILSVKSYDCHLGAKATDSPYLCSPRDRMLVQVDVDKILRLAKSTSTLDSRFIPKEKSQFEMYINAFGAGANRYQPLLLGENAPAPMTDGWLNHNLAGRSFVFGAGTEPSGPPGLDKGPALLAGYTLPTESLSWVKNTILSCNPNLQFYR
jgi:hypothetical protein